MIFGCDQCALEEPSNCTKRLIQGREMCDTITLESIVDYNTGFLHALFGFPGSMTNIYIWEYSGLLKLMLISKHEEIDHTFALDGCNLSRIVKIFSTRE